MTRKTEPNLRNPGWSSSTAPSAHGATKRKEGTLRLSVKKAGIRRNTKGARERVSLEKRFGGGKKETIEKDLV